MSDWTSEARTPGIYVVRHFWEDGTQCGTDYLYRYTGGGKWVDLIGDTDKRLMSWDDNARLRFYGPLPSMPVELIPS